MVKKQRRQRRGRECKNNEKVLLSSFKERLKSGPRAGQNARLSYFILTVYWKRTGSIGPFCFHYDVTKKLRKFYSKGIHMWRGLVSIENAFAVRYIVPLV